MKKLAIIFSLLAVCGFVFGACGDDDGGGPHCVKNPYYCDPACDIMAGQFCCSNACVDIATCDPECNADTQYCDPCGGGCMDTPADCDPACETGFTCDDGTCVEDPVCDPVCAADEYCAP